MSPRKPNPFAAVGGKKPDLIVHTAERSATARALAHLFANEPQPRIFARIDGTLVFVVRVPDGGAELRVLSRDHLINLAHDICQPIKRTEQGRVEVSLPDRVSDLTLATLTGEHLLPTIVGTTTGPTLRADGDVRCTPGFDAASGLFICDAPTLTLPERPTIEDARQALQQLRQAFRTFAFADRITKSEQFDVDGKQVATDIVDLDKAPGHDESGFLHALLTAACRSVLWLAPAFVYRSPSISGSGVGKSLLAKAPSVIAFGELPQTALLGEKEEFDKGLTALLLRGGHSVLIDNLNNKTLRSNALCSALSERPAFLRIMGLGKLAPVNSTALISLTGCALAIGRDLVRRTVVIDLDAKIEDPEQRKFKAGFLDDIRARRVDLLQYALTILRWGRQNPSVLKHGETLGGYDNWLAWIRDPLLTLDCPDPVARLAKLKIADPDRVSVFDTFERWWENHHDSWVAASKLDDEVQQLLLRGRKFSRQRINYEVRALVGTRIADYLFEEKKSETNKWAAAEFRLIKTNSPRAREGFYDQKDAAATTPEAAAPYPTGKEEKEGLPYEVLGPAPGGERCTICGTGGPERIRHGGHANLWHRACADKYLAAITDPPVKVPEPPPDPLDEHGAPLADAVAESDPDADGWQFNREPESGPQPTAHAAQPEAESKEPTARPDAFNAEGRLAIWRNAFAPLSAETEPCPGWRPDEWPRVHACIKQFLNGPHAFTAARNGWSALDLFGIHKVVGAAARDCVGALTGNTTNGFVARIEADGALQFTNGTKARKRPFDSNLCIPIWSFRAPTTAPH